MSTESPSIRIMLADAHALVRAGLCLLIGSKPGMTVVGEAGNFAQALEIATHTQPDIILLELNLDDTGVEIILPLLAAAKRARVLLVTSIQDAGIHYQAIQLGAVGIVTKEQSGDTLGKAIEKVQAGQLWLDRSTTANVLAKMTRARSTGEESNGEVTKIALLSPRERDVINLVGRGLKNKEIAASLSLSETTVRHHFTSIFSKLEVSDRLELIIYAYQNHLAELPH